MTGAETCDIGNASSSACVNCGLSISISGSGESTYQGCFIDSSTRDLPNLLTYYGSLSEASCAAAGRAAGYLYVGLQAGVECWGGNSYGSQGSGTGCVSTCGGSECGGAWRNSVYTVSRWQDPIFLSCSEETVVFINQYNESQSIRWPIRTEASCVLRVSWVKFFTQYNHDFIEVIDPGSALTLGIFSGDQLPPRICSQTSSVDINFDSDNDITCHHEYCDGFRAIITAVAPNSMTCDNDAIFLQSWTELAMIFDVSDLAAACAVENSPFGCDSMDPPHLISLTLSGLISFGTSLPEQICQFQHLSILELADTNLTGSIPDWLCDGSLPRLWKINLASNFLTGQLPECIWGKSNLPNRVHLESIQLQNNLLSGEIPDAFPGPLV